MGLLNGSLVEKSYRWAESAGEHKRNDCQAEGGLAHGGGQEGESLRPYHKCMREFGCLRHVLLSVGVRTGI